jgi:DNA polymerase-3 subunit delta
VISIIVGENSFENERALLRIVANFDGMAERFEGEVLELKQLPDLLMGMSLFATKRLVVIKNMSANKSLWNAFENWIEKVSDDIHLVLIDSKPDKRTKTYKMLQKNATIYESKVWLERDSSRAEQWVAEEAKALGFALDKKNAHALVVRAGVDQWKLWQSLQKLAVLDGVTPEVIDEIIEPNETENAFQLFESALKGDIGKVKRMLTVLEKTEEPYRLFGLLGGQAFQLAILGVSEAPSATVASDLGVHPFVLSKLSPFSKQLGRSGVKRVVAAFAEADTAMKTLGHDPWLLIERALLKVAKTA